MHDENGHVDPVKAAETPVPRGSLPSKKRQSVEDGSPLLQAKKKQRLSDASPDYAPLQPPPGPQMLGHGVLKPQIIGHDREPKPVRPKSPNSVPHNPAYPPYNPGTRTAEQKQPAAPEEEEQPPIDPNLFSMYPEPGYDEHGYAYPTTEQPQPYNPPQSSYNIPSLEQIANEVLVDMNGNEYQEQSNPQAQVQAFDEAHDAAPMTNGCHEKTNESVDSAVSLPATRALERKSAGAAPLADGEGPADTNTSNEVAGEEIVVHHELPPPPAHPSIEMDAVCATSGSTSETKTSPAAAKSSVSNLPLYQPPAPLSQSPEIVKRGQHVMTNGASHSHSPTVEHNNKRKRDSTSATPGTKSAKKVKEQWQGSGESEAEVDQKTLELAKMLQQEELGLRRRSK